MMHHSFLWAVIGSGNELILVISSVAGTWTVSWPVPRCSALSSSWYLVVGTSHNLGQGEGVASCGIWCWLVAMVSGMCQGIGISSDAWCCARARAMRVQSVVTDLLGLSIACTWNVKLLIGAIRIQGLCIACALLILWLAVVAWMQGEDASLQSSKAAWWLALNVGLVGTSPCKLWWSGRQTLIPCALRTHKPMMHWLTWVCI